MDRRPFDQLEGPLQKKYKKMTSGLCDFLNDFGLISFIAMNIEDGEVLNHICFEMRWVICFVVLVRRSVGCWQRLIKLTAIG